MNFAPTRYDLMFRIKRSIRYNSRRQRFFETVDRMLSLFLILLGSGAVATQANFTDRLEFWLVITIGALVAILSSVMLVYVPGVRAVTHKQFVKEFTQLEIELSMNSSKETTRQVWHNCLSLEATEPPVMRVLDLLCHNELCLAEDIKDREQYVAIGWFKRLTAQIFSWEEHGVKKGEVTVGWFKRLTARIFSWEEKGEVTKPDQES